MSLFESTEPLRSRILIGMAQIYERHDGACGVAMLLPRVEDFELVHDAAYQICVARAEYLRDVLLKNKQEADNLLLFLNSYIKEAKEKRIYG